MYADIIEGLKERAEKAFFDLELVTKNINNVSTPSYKAERPLSFEDELGKVQRNLEAGKLMVTENPNDVSLEGKGFFVLKDENDETVLLRNITLGQDKDGNLAYRNFIICPQKELPTGITSYKVETNGEILGQKVDGTSIPITKLKVINFPSSENLSFDGEVFRPTEKAGIGIEICLGPLEQTKVRQKTQELSNVHIPSEFSKFTENRDRLTTISRLNQLLSTSEREYIRNLTNLI